jgi:hypothetical protein
MAEETAVIPLDPRQLKVWRGVSPVGRDPWDSARPWPNWPRPARTLKREASSTGPAPTTASRIVAVPGFLFVARPAPPLCRGREKLDHARLAQETADKIRDVH